MNKIHIVSKTGCPFCVKAKEWFNNNNIEYSEEVLDDMVERNKFYDKIGLINNRTVPQIFINDVRIGGYSELMKSEFAKKYHDDF